jgi:hypothetical protein
METVESLSKRLEALEHIGVGLLVVLLIGALGLAQPLRAAEFTCASGDVTCLIDAINKANANGKANRITLRRGTYTLTVVDNDANGLPVITSALTITGQGAETTIIERGSVVLFRILSVAPAGTLTLQRLTLRGGVVHGAGGSGGGISNSGTLTLIDSILTRNGAEGMGGGISNSGTLTLIDSILTENGAAGEFEFDAGGGLFNNGGTVTITRSTFDTNSGEEGAGGILNVNGTMTIANSTIVLNSAEGLVNSCDALVIGPCMATVTLTNTTVAKNSGFNAPAAGGISNGGTMLLQSTTVAENRPGPFSVSVQAGGIDNSGTVLLQNSIIARNMANENPNSTPDCKGLITSLGNNLIGDPTGCDITLQPTDLTGDPGLGTFTDNGSPGNGHFPLLSTSQAIDAGNNAVCFRTDQLGRRRIGPCDIGAISFRDKDDRQHEENIANAYR